MKQKIYHIQKSKNSELLSKPTHKKVEETLEHQDTQPRETFSYKRSISIEGSWMIGLASLEVCNNIFNITDDKNQFQLFTDNFREFSFAELTDELEEILGFKNVTPKPLQHHIKTRYF